MRGTLYLQVCDDHADALLRSGRADEVVPVLRRLVAEYPLRERLHVLLIRSLRAAGETGAAWAALADAGAVLRQELGVDPGPELQQVRRSLSNPA